MGILVVNYLQCPSIVRVRPILNRKIVSPRPSLNVTDQVAHLYWTNDKCTA